MSNYLAIATVTEALRQMLDAAVGSVVPGATATAIRPNTTGTGALTGKTCVNVFLYQITPNATWRNTDLPSRNSGGDIVRRPRAALDLHYLFSFHGKDSELEPQRLLGRTVQVLHAHPLLTSHQVRDAVTSNSHLSGSNLAEEIERVRVTPLHMSLEELAKIWSVFFQNAYALSTAYQASVVLIEGDEAPRTPLPVLTRTVRVSQYQRPVIEEVSPMIVETGATLTIRGRGLNADKVRIRLGRLEIAPATLSGESAIVTIPAGLRAGIVPAQVVQFIDFGTGLRSDPHRSCESNVLPFVLAPRLTLPAGPEPVFGHVARGTNLLLTVSPPVGREQDVSLLVGGRSIALPPRLPAAPATTSALSVPLPADLPTGAFLLRLQVDGAQSRLGTDAAGFTGPFIFIDGGIHSLRCTGIQCAATATGVSASVQVGDENAVAMAEVEVGFTWTLPDGSTQSDMQRTGNAGTAVFAVAGPAGNYGVAIDRIGPTTVGGFTFHFDQAQSVLTQVFVK